jgi:hypothetical protein
MIGRYTTGATHHVVGWGNRSSLFNFLAVVTDSGTKKIQEKNNPEQRLRLVRDLSDFAKE